MWKCVHVILAGFYWNLDFLGRVSQKSLNIKFNQNPSSGNRVVPRGRTDRHDEAATFRNFTNALKIVAHSDNHKKQTPSLRKKKPFDLSAYDTYSYNGGFESREGQEVFLFSKSSGPALGPTQPSIKWGPGFVPGSKLAEMWSLPLTSM